MKKTYQKADFNIIELEQNDVITTSSTTQLKDGGANGTGASESYSSLFN